MAETKTAEALSQEVEKQDYGIYNQGRIKLNYNEDTQDWSEQYEPVKGYQMFIPPQPKKVSLPTDVTVPETPAVEQPTAPTTEVTQPAEPIVERRDRGESLAERQQREMMERFGPGQDPMQTADRIASIFTPGTEQYSYYDSIGVLNLTDKGALTVNFDQIDEKGGYGLPSLLGGALKFAEKDIIKNTLNKLRYAGIIEGGPEQIEDAKGIYAFNVNQDKFNSYVENAPRVADLLRGNREILEQLGKLDRNAVDEFVADMAVGMSNDNTRNVIENALQGKTKGAAAALIAFQTGEEIDLDKKGFFGNDFYSDRFKQDYLRTLEELEKTQGELGELKDTQEELQQTQEEERKKLLDEIDELLKKREEERGGEDTTPPPAPTPTPKPPSTPGASGPPGRDYPTTTTTPPSVPKPGTVGASGPPGRDYPTKSSSTSSKSSSSGGGNKSSSSSGSGTRSGLVSSNKSSSSSTKRAAPVKSTLTGGKLAGTKGYTRGR